MPNPPEASYFAARTLHKHFGGIIGGRGILGRAAPRRDRRPDRPEWFGQDHDHQPGHGRAKPDGGAIMLNGRDIVGMPAYAFARAGVGRTFQVPRLFRRMTVIENLMVPALTEPRTTHRQAEARAREILAFVRFEHLADAYARTLSGGQQKLLELGRALMLRPASCCSTSRSRVCIRVCSSRSSSISAR